MTPETHEHTAQAPWNQFLRHDDRYVSVSTGGNGGGSSPRMVALLVAAYFISRHLLRR